MQQNTIVLGVDVSKATLDAALWLQDTDKWHACKVNNTAGGYRKLMRWAQGKARAEPGQIRVALEATGVYHERATQALYEAGYPVIVANPKRVRDFARGLGMLGKNDRADARALARYSAHGKGMLWSPPAPEIRTLRALLARLNAIKGELQRERNRLQLACEQTAGDACDVVIASLERSIKAKKIDRAELLREINRHYDRHKQLKAERKLLRTAPSIGQLSADYLLCLLRGRTFESARQAAALCALVPIEHTSGTSVRKHPRLTGQGDGRLRSTLYMACVSALRHNRQLRAIYDRLVAKGKAHKAALGALMRHMVHIAYGILKHQTPYNPAMVSKGPETA